MPYATPSILALDYGSKVTKTLLQIENLSTVLDSESGLLRAIDSLSLTLDRGETFALVGESGCGKSMTALSLLRLLPDNGRIEQGAIKLGEQNLCELREFEMREIRGRKVSIIFQEPSTSLNPVMKVGQQIIEVIERHSDLRGVAAREKAINWLKRVGIPEPERRVDTYPFEMSGGQKQRVMIALALAAEPDLLIADEPTTALDVTIQKQILELLQSLQREQGMAMFLITHDLGIVSDMAHRIALMYAGQIVEVADTEDFFKAPAHPYAKLLLKALPDVNKRGERLAAIPGSVPALSTEFLGCRFADRCSQVNEACRARDPALTSLSAKHSVRCTLYGSRAALADGVPAQGEFAKAQHGVVDPPSATPLPVAETRKNESLSVQALEGQTLLEVSHLSVRFPIRKGLLSRARSHVVAVDDVSFKIPVGRTLALVGESGCGKTTIGKAVLQLLRGRAQIDGQALLSGENLFALQGAALRDARRHIQIIFQDPYSSLNPRMRVSDILEEGMLHLQTGLSKEERLSSIAQLIEKVGLRPDALTRYPHEFSGGQRQRIAIARALAVRPKIIICDEPTSALDVSVQAQILNLLSDLQEETGVSYLFITHNIGVVEYVAHEVAVMQNGKILETGLASEVLSRPQHNYTQTLLAAVPRVRA
jgi:peptide/nickel transport system ATP-binding protein